MEGFLIFVLILLAMSLTLNILMYNAISKKDRDFRDIKEAYDDIKKHYASFDKLAKKHARLFGGGK